MGTSLDDGASCANTQIWSNKNGIQTIPHTPMSWSDIPVLLLNQPNDLKHNCLIIPFFGRYTKETQSKRKVHFSYEADPSVTMFSAAWNKKNLFALHKAWFVNLSARLVRVDLSGNYLEELPEELLNTLPFLEVLDVSNNKLQYLPEVTSTFTRYYTWNMILLCDWYSIYCHALFFWLWDLGHVGFLQCPNRYRNLIWKVLKKVIIKIMSVMVMITLIITLTERIGWKQRDWYFSFILKHQQICFGTFQNC